MANYIVTDLVYNLPCHIYVLMKYKKSLQTSRLPHKCFPQDHWKIKKGNFKHAIWQKEKGNQINNPCFPISHYTGASRAPLLYSSISSLLFTGSVIQGVSEITNLKTLTSSFSFYILLLTYPPLAESLAKFLRAQVCCCLSFVPISQDS